MKPAKSAALACLAGIAIAAFAPPASAQMERQPWRSSQSVSPGDPAPEPMMEPAPEPPYPGSRSAPSPGVRSQPGYPPGYQAPSQPGAPGVPKVYQQPSAPVTQPAQRPSPSQPVSPGLRGPRPASPDQPVTSPRGYGGQPPSPGGMPPPVAGPPDWPIKRPANPVIVRPRDPRYWDDDRWRHDRRHDHRYWRRAPLLYLPLIVFGGGIAYDTYPYDRWGSRLLWEDSVVLEGEEGWVEFTLDSGAAGQRLWFEIRDGRAQVDWAEVVYSDGTSQVIDFNERSLGPGLYRLMDFYYYRGVEYVRVVARATTNRVWIILRLEG